MGRATRLLREPLRRQLRCLRSRAEDDLSNPDGSTTVSFGPEPPPGMESNWVQTVPTKGWFTILRLYGPLESWFDKTWKPGEIEIVN